ncbi:MAG: hypothetical protein JRI89_09295 [Deltaproteobacteria bacterium]|nr:hypothetical protein [Deltaproteobacteria bacterium]
MARQQVYAYSLEGSVEDLKQWTEEYLGTSMWHWVADPARLEVGEGLPIDWKDQGSAFNEWGELRWWCHKDTYEALLVTEQTATGLTPLPGLWQAEIQSVFLQNLREQRVNPNFVAYPGGNAAGKIEVRVCYRDGTATLVSLRKFLPE